METLSDDLLPVLFSTLPVNSLCACEAVSKDWQAAAADDTIWRQHCKRHWPSSNVGPVAPTHKECFRSANGWQKLSLIPRLVYDDLTHRDPTIRARRSSSAELATFDATDDLLITSSRSDGSHKVRLHRPGEPAHLRRGFDDGQGHWISDIKLLPAAHGGGELPRALAVINESLCAIDLSRLEPGVLSSLDAVGSQIWTNNILDGSLLTVLPAADGLSALCRTDSGIIHLDLGGGEAVLTRNLRYLLEAEPDYVISACSDSVHAPNEASLAVRGGQRSYILHTDLRLPGASAFVGTHRTGHGQIRRLAHAGDGSRTVLASHSRSKDIQIWDLRMLRDYSENPRTAAWASAADTFTCSGNAPDFSCEHGIIAAVSAGTPGTTYGARLQIFSSSPRRLSETINLPEIVLDENYRLMLPQGVKLTGRHLHFAADKTRVIQCAVP